MFNCPTAGGGLSVRIRLRMGMNSSTLIALGAALTFAFQSFGEEPKFRIANSGNKRVLKGLSGTEEFEVEIGGLRHGSYKQVNPPKVVEGQYEHGQKVGTWKEYYMGVLSKTTMYRTGLRNGQEVEYYYDPTNPKVNDRIKSITTYKDDKRNGVFRSYFSDPVGLSEEGEYKDDKQVGVWTKWNVLHHPTRIDYSEKPSQ